MVEFTRRHLLLHLVIHKALKLRRVLNIHNFLGAGNYGALNSATSLGSGCCPTVLVLLLDSTNYTVRKPSANPWKQCGKQITVAEAQYSTVQYNTIQYMQYSVIPYST